MRDPKCEKSYVPDTYRVYIIGEWDQFRINLKELDLSSGYLCVFSEETCFGPFDGLTGPFA